MGNKDLAEMAAGRMDKEGQGMTNAGKICGLIGTILLGVGVIFGILAVVLGFGGAMMSN
ncbi:MAG: hypothetical protein R3F11_03215 [Verrucomicrobiales bacterium]